MSIIVYCDQAFTPPSRPKKSFWSNPQYNDDTLRQIHNKILQDYPSKLKDVSRIIGIDETRYDIIYEIVKIYKIGQSGTSSGTGNIYIHYYITFDKLLNLYVVYKKFDTRGDTTWGINWFSYPLLIKTIELPKQLIKEQFENLFYNINNFEIHVDGPGGNRGNLGHFEYNYLFIQIVKLFEQLTLMYKEDLFVKEIEIANKKIKEITELSQLQNRQYIFMKKTIDSKVKLIEELKKKCKSISNSLPRKSKKTFKPTLNTIPNTKTRNSKARRSRSQPHND